MSPGLSTLGTFMSSGLAAPGTFMSLGLPAVDYFQTVTKMPVSQAKRTVVVRNLPEDTTKNEIVAKFCEYGSVYKVKFLGEIAILIKKIKVAYKNGSNVGTVIFHDEASVDCVQEACPILFRGVRISSTRLLFSKLFSNNALSTNFS